MRRHFFTKSISLLLCIALVVTTIPASALAAVNKENDTLKAASKARDVSATDAFKMALEKEMNVSSAETKKENTIYRPEARWWMASGSHTDETLRESIQELYDNGFGAVEFVTQSDENVDNVEYGWGSEEWVHDTKVIMEKCNELGMGVSFTSGTHWATANLFTITPDDDAASKELGYRTIELKGGEKFEGNLPIPQLPDGVKKAKFVKLVKAEVTGAGSMTIKKDSLEDLSGQVTGIADNKATVSYTAPAGDGHYVLFAFWMYGTGESYQPAKSDSYTINYFDKIGVETLIDYWDNHVLTADVKKLIAENNEITGSDRVQMYMDSLELNTRGKETTGLLWSNKMLATFQTSRGYDMAKYLPILIYKSGGSGMGPYLTYKYTIEGEDGATLSKKIRRDLLQVNTELYQKECLAPFRAWLNDNGIALRAEPSYGRELELSQPIKDLDYVEAESLEFAGNIESYRGLAGGAHLFDKVYSSETGAMISANFVRTSDYKNNLFYTQFASGIQRTVIHVYTSAYGPEESTDWPGFVSTQIWSDRFNNSQVNALDYPTLMGEHFTRIQKILRSGVAMMDLGILRTEYNTWNAIFGNLDQNFMHQHKGVHWEDLSLQDAGYTYDYFSPAILADTDVKFDESNGVVQSAKGDANYQALLVYEEELPLAAAQRMLEWAKKGLKVILVDGPTNDMLRNDVTKKNEKAAITTGFNDGKDEELAAVMTELKKQPSVKAVARQTDVYQALRELGVRPRAEFGNAKQQNLLTAMRKDGDTTYLYVYNYRFVEDKDSYKDTISLPGKLVPYVINTWNGKVERVGAYTYDAKNNRTILTNVDIEPGEVVMYALNGEADAAAAAPSGASSITGVKKVVVDGDKFIAYVGNGAKAYVNYDGKAKDLTTSDVSEDIAVKDWNIVVEKWSKGDRKERKETQFGHTTTEITYDTKKEDIKVAKSDLIPWKDMPEVGAEVSGVGTYIAKFTVPDTFDAGKTAYILDGGSFSGGTAKVTVNGTDVMINMDSEEADITNYVKKGENEIVIRVTSSLKNVIIAQGYLGKPYGGWFGPQTPDNYGLVGDVTIKAYSKVDLAAASEADAGVILDDMLASQKEAEEAKKKAEKAEEEAAAAQAEAAKKAEEAERAAQLAAEKEEEAKKAAELAAQKEAEAKKAADEKEAEAKKAADAKAAQKTAEEKAAAAAAARKTAEDQAAAAAAARKAAEKAKAEAEAAKKAAEKAAAKAKTDLAKVKFKNSKMSLKSVKSSKKKKAVVTWKKVNGANGYQLQYGTKSNFKGAKKVTVKKGGTVKTTIKKLKSGKIYYFRIRSYKRIDGKNVYTSYSAKKSVRIK